MSAQESADRVGAFLSAYAQMGSTDAIVRGVRVGPEKHELTTEDLRVLIDHARATAEPEIVTGAEAVDLPPRSIVVACRTDGTPWGSSSTVQRLDIGWKNGGGNRIDRLDLPQPYRVLYRAPEPPPVIEVGQTITTAAGLDACPAGTVVRETGSTGAYVFVRATRDWLHGEHAAQPTLPARVLDVPEATS